MVVGRVGWVFSRGQEFLARAEPSIQECARGGEPWAWEEHRGVTRVTQEGFLEAVSLVLNLQGNQARGEREFQAEETAHAKAWRLEGRFLSYREREEEIPRAWPSRLPLPQAIFTLLPSPSLYYSNSGPLFQSLNLPAHCSPGAFALALPSAQNGGLFSAFRPLLNVTSF